MFDSVKSSQADSCIKVRNVTSCLLLTARDDFIEFHHCESFRTYTMFDAEGVLIHSGKI